MLISVTNNFSVFWYFFEVEIFLQGRGALRMVKFSHFRSLALTVLEWLKSFIWEVSVLILDNIFLLLWGTHGTQVVKGYKKEVQVISKCILYPPGKIYLYSWNKIYTVNWQFHTVSNTSALSRNVIDRGG